RGPAAGWWGRRLWGAWRGGPRRAVGGRAFRPGRHPSPGEAFGTAVGPEHRSLRHEATASGRATRRASSDPACLLPPPSRGPLRWQSNGPGPGRGGGEAGSQAGSSADFHAPDGGYLTETAPSGDLPDTTASGRGASFTSGEG